MEYIFACLVHSYGEKDIRGEEKEKGKKNQTNLSLSEKKRKNVEDSVGKVEKYSRKKITCQSKSMRKKN